MGVRNMWSLNVDELLVADKIKNEFSKKDYEVFFPLNSQMKDIDLLFVSLKTNKRKSLQVKGSRTYSPQNIERERYGKGSAAWFTILKKSIFTPSNKVDFYVFVLHSLRDTEHKKDIKIDFLIIPIADFRRICKKKSTRKKDGRYDFYIWIDSKDKRSFEFRDSKQKPIPLSKYLNNWKLLK